MQNQNGKTKKEMTILFHNKNHMTAVLEINFFFATKKQKTDN